MKYLVIYSNMHIYILEFLSYFLPKFDVTYLIFFVISNEDVYNNLLYSHENLWKSVVDRCATVMAMLRFSIDGFEMPN